MKAKVIATGETIYDVEEYLFDVGRFQVHGRTKEGISVFFRAEEVTLLPKEFQEKDIDWDQRRYEIAKALYVGFLTSNNKQFVETLAETKAKWALDDAETLIKELKKHS